MKANNKLLLTSESVSAGHPDKICDQIADAILDACLAQDPYSRVACEVFALSSKIIIAGEITSMAVVNFEQIARDTLKLIGYVHDYYRFDKVVIEVYINSQSPDIAQGVNNLGAGDQGIMFGFATNETSGLMPLPIVLAHKLVRMASQLHLEGKFPYSLPDMKSQVSIDYTNPYRLKIDQILMSIQHQSDFDEIAFKEFVHKEIMIPVAQSFNLNTDFSFLINPTGRFVIGGPVADTGLTGRKIIIDTYGGSARHGGGSFSGKDATKVDRSAAYMGRYIAKNIVAAGLADKIEIQLAYAIGVAEPVSIMINTYGTEKIHINKILEAIRENFDLRPQAIIEKLELRAPRYRPLAAYGHFGRPDLDLPWERTDKVEELRKLLSPINSNRAKQRLIIDN
ncbi:s-adenosylmethionine synthetase [Holotrichia oblita]|nr:s-adenosylmethionine synthetase [Holotrichia oblita]